MSRAIESGDARYLIASYADGAELRLFDSDHPRQAPQTLRSRSAIAGWIEDMYIPGQAHRVVGSTADADSVALVEECTHADGGRGMWAYSAEVAGGQIIRATAMVTAAEATPTRGPAGGPSETALLSLNLAGRRQDGFGADRGVAAGRVGRRPLAARQLSRLREASRISSGPASINQVGAADEFDLAGFARALEAGDAHTQLAAYAEHAEVRIVDPDNPPRSPQILRGQPAIGAWIRGGVVPAQR